MSDAPQSVAAAMKWVLLAAIVVAVFVALSVLKTVYTDWLWYDDLGLRSVYSAILVTRIWLFFVAAIVSATFLAGNLYLAHRFTRGASILPIPEDAQRLLRVAVVSGAAFGVFLLALILGAVASGRWESFIRFQNNVPFNSQDPLFGKDISFYVATLPVLNFIQGWFLGLVIATLAGVALMYLANLSVRGLSFVLTPRMRAQLAVLGALLMLAIAAKHFLDIYGLVFSTRGAAYGAGYADVQARLPALRLLVAVSIVAAGLLVGSIFFKARQLRLMGAAAGLWMVAALVVGGIFPALYQRLVVTPNEFNREAPYIERNIQATRHAFNLDKIKEESYAVSPGLTAADVAANPLTINNIRLWDYLPLRDVYNQIQFLSQYYGFVDVDVDRYIVDSQYRQVMLSARELFPEKLEASAQNWVNRKLQYTHGYGVAMSPVTEFTPEGRPLFFVKDIPPVGQIPVERPQIYFGENTKDYVVVDSRMEEYDYPTQDRAPVYANYQGQGGVSLSSFLKRAAFAWQMGDLNLLISGQIASDSKLQYRRQIQERVHTLAPFLKLDRDPYIVIADGRLFWIQDAYTTTDRYPYSTPYESYNYIRNSVKVVIDAYEGSVQFFVADQQDPVLLMYRDAFPSLFTPMSEMPASLQAHIRYPEDLFQTQAQVYLRYHMQDPRVFFTKEDQWSIPTETFFGKSQPVEPYYVIMKLPGEENEEFVMILPFTPVNKPNMAAWVAARSDPAHYGELLAFMFSKERQVDGPSQIEARIDNDPIISAQFTLWGQSGSRVIRGNLITIPIANTIIFVEPIYLQAENFPFPELKQVIVATTDRVQMRPTLNEALFAVIGKAPPPVAQPPTPGSGQGEPPDKMQAAIDSISQAIQSLKDALEKLQQSLDKLKGSVGGTQ